MPLRAKGSASGTVMSPRLRQPTATQGLDGTNWNRSLFDTTVIRSPGRARSFSS